MPHFIVEYSANLEGGVDVPELLRVVHRAAIETGVFPLKGTRTRAARRDQYVIADEHADNAFVHVLGRIGSGREPDIKKRAAEAVFNAVCEFLSAYAEHHPLAISCEMQEIDPVTSFKNNNLPEWIARRQPS